MTDKQVEKLLNEIRGQYKERMKDLFHELTTLHNDPCTHLFRKTTYKVELTFPEWCSLEERYLGNFLIEIERKPYDNIN